MIKINRNNEVFSESTLLSFEKKIGFKLPPDFTSFIKKYNGGVPEANQFSFADDYIAIDAFFGFNEPNNISKEYDFICDEIPRGLISIANIAGGDRLLLGVEKSIYARVYIWSHEESTQDLSSIILLSESFSNFLSSIKPLVVDTDNSSKSGTVLWVDPEFFKKYSNYFE